MYVTESPEVAAAVAERARKACRGSAQAEWIWWMLGPGFQAEFQGRWAGAVERRFAATLDRLGRAGIRTEALPLGYQGKDLWFITGEFSPIETELRRCEPIKEWDRDPRGP